MTLYPVYTPQDTTQAAESLPYDSIWAQVPVRDPDGLERVMLAEGKIYVVLAVVLIIWFGLLFFILRTDRKIRGLERTLEGSIPEEQ